MVGRLRGDELQVMTPGAPALFAAAERIGAKSGVKVVPNQTPDARLVEMSDTHMFKRLGVPVAMMFTGFHPDYHQQGDEAGKIEGTMCYASRRHTLGMLPDHRGLRWRLAAGP